MVGRVNFFDSEVFPPFKKEVSQTASGIVITDSSVVEEALSVELLEKMKREEESSCSLDLVRRKEEAEERL